MSERQQPTISQSLLQLWRLAPRRMRNLVMRGVAFRVLQSLCLAAIFGLVAGVSLLLSHGQSVSPDMIIASGLLTILLLLVQFRFAHWSTRCIWLTAFRLVGAIRRRLLRRLMRLPLTFHQAHPQADLANSMTSDLSLVENLLTDGLPRLVHALALPLFALLVIGLIDPVTAGFAVLPIIAALPLLQLSCRHLARLTAAKKEAQAEATERILECAAGMATVRSLGLLEHRREAFTAPLIDIHRISVLMVAQLTAPLLGFGAVIMGGLALLVAVAGLRHDAGAISSGQMTAILVLAFPASAPLLGLAPFMELAAVAQGAIARLTAIMAAEMPGPSEPVSLPGRSIRFENVGFAYRRSMPAILKNVSFDVPRDGLTAVIGRSGIGKSTLLNLLAGLLSPTEGRILIDGVDTRKIGADTMNGLVSVVFQDVKLLGGTIRDNIAMGNPAATDAEIRKAAAMSRADGFIMALPAGYETRVGDGGIPLSGGERQRISLARALLKDTPILLVDEGTASVDAVTANTIGETLLKLADSRTVIVVTHEKSAVSAYQRTIMLDNGTVIEGSVARPA